jgi:hypothetical protein
VTSAFFKIQFTNDMSLQDYIQAQIDGWTRIIESSRNGPSSDELRIFNFIYGLPPRFESHPASVLTSSQDEELTLDDITIKLQGVVPERLQLKQNRGSDESPEIPKAFKAVQKHYQNKRKRDQGGSSTRRNKRSNFNSNAPFDASKFYIL